VVVVVVTTTHREVANTIGVEVDRGIARNKFMIIMILGRGFI